ncbi:GNAT family N-acetyltransferase [Sphingomicrobium sp. XHP0239]|uniref:GNAT family N-acetyltransferase n=1 Tax=Sphingomicrobium maritimum TaxID=3133972 RepID=UPI0031CC4C81
MASQPRPRELLLQRGCFDDLDQVMPIMEAAFDPCFGEAWSRSQCGGILPMRGVEMWLARTAGGTALGFALWRTIAGDSELLLLGVDPTAQGHGIGSALLAQFLVQAKQEGARRLHLEVRDGNAAVGLYEKAGFHLAGRRCDYYRGCDNERHDALTYSLYIE